MFLHVHRPAAWPAASPKKAGLRPYPVGFFWLLLLVLGLGLSGGAVAQEAAKGSAPQSEKASEDSGIKRPSKLEFDDRLVTGQTPTSGAVYLFTRAPRALPALVPLRRSYREQVVQPVLGARPLKPVVAEPSVEGSAKGETGRP